MKRNVLILHFLLATFCTTFFFSCKKDKDDRLSGRSADVLELIKRSTASNSGGFIHLVEEMAMLASVSQLDCNHYSDTTLHRDNGNPSLTPFTYDVLVRREMLCTSGTPTRISFAVQGNHDFETIRLKDESSVNMSNIIERLTNADADWQFTIAYARSGTIKSKMRDLTIRNNFSINSGDLTIDKTSLRISGGTARVDVMWEEGDQPSIIFSANITFHGKNRATIQFEGNNHQLHW